MLDLEACDLYNMLEFLDWIHTNDLGKFEDDLLILMREAQKTA